MIEVNGVSFKYRGSRKQVLSNLNLEIKENNICGLLGKNGVGKSTLLYLLSGLLRPASGTVKINGMEAQDANPEMLKDIFLVSEEFTLPSVKLSEYVKMNEPFYPNFSHEILEKCLEDFELPQELNLGQLSMGQKKKVFMSFALASNTKILLMDEPTNGLDIPSKSQFRKAVSRSMNDDRIIIISTHQVHDVDQLLDHVVILSNDGVLLNKSTEEICQEYVFEYRMPNDMDDVIYAEPSLQGNAVMAPRRFDKLTNQYDKPETPLNLELLFNAIITKK